MIYLACPYSHPSDEVRVFRFHQANRAASKMMKEGHFVYSPISHSHPIAEDGGLPLHWAYWQSVDEFYIKLCQKVVVLKLEGWEKSEGVKAEMAIAEAYGKPIEYIEGTA